MSNYANDNNLKPGLRGQLTSFWNKIERVGRYLINEVPVGIKDSWNGKATSFTDPITGLGNRAAYNKALPRMINNATHHGNSQDVLCVIYMDLDGFKAINDQHGHAAGDGCLREFGELIYQHLSPRQEDFVGRIGGDEVAVIAFGKKEAIEKKVKDFREFMDQRRSQIPDNATPGDKQKKYSFSYGISATDTDFLNTQNFSNPNHFFQAIKDKKVSKQDIADKLTNLADQAMYADKKIRQSARSVKPAPGLAA